MQFNYKKEIVNVLMALLPLVYLAFIWSSLPDTVPIHWNARGEADRVGNKIGLTVVPFLLPITTYLLLSLMYYIKPIAKLRVMGNKFHQLKFVIVFFMSMVAMYILYSAKGGTNSNPNVVTILIGAFFAIIGNYMPTIRRNFFLGIRTPWTLSSDNNWKLTHRLASKLWVAGGLLIIITGFFLREEINIKLFLTVVAIIVLIPLAYSYKIYRSEKGNEFISK